VAKSSCIDRDLNIRVYYTLQDSTSYNLFSITSVLHIESSAVCVRLKGVYLCILLYDKACNQIPAVHSGQWRKWMLQLTTFLTHQNGTIHEGLNLWKRNVDKRFQGVEVL
jgi:hypothetical protein